MNDSPVREPYFFMWTSLYVDIPLVVLYCLVHCSRFYRERPCSACIMGSGDDYHLGSNRATGEGCPSGRRLTDKESLPHLCRKRLCACSHVVTHMRRPHFLAPSMKRQQGYRAREDECSICHVSWNQTLTPRENVSSLGYSKSDRGLSQAYERVGPQALHHLFSMKALCCSVPDPGG